MCKQNIDSLIQKFLPFIVIKGGILLVSSEVALPFAKALTEKGEVIVGCCTWSYVGVDADKRYIVQNLTVDLTLEDFVPWLDMTANTNWPFIQTFIENLEGNVDFISFDLVS